MKTSRPKSRSKPPVTEKRQNKAKYLTRDSIRVKFVKNTSMPNPVKNLVYVAPELIKALAILSDATVRRSAVDQEDLSSC